ncbi:molecular chaperone HtpG [Natronogracilivirga saccharolytica]|uniref:Chaperone protein HtpG n=1 Tax=Natronogracilivirga saccharolytica TaxID=2812953 RepID=A0A8J7RL74_9BACT|nr:molecular chaperone HtpG [Natronogracilivirga saccharolytica]MBP3191719.1 molecular chaperone HtpG [Natronogracilivirga saccharolytica]
MAKKTKQQFEFKAEMKQLLNLIVNSLYTNPEVFLRELISNSSDALNKVRFKQVTGEKVQSPKLAAQIRINVDEEKQTFAIEDTGIGMTFEDLTERLGTVASSGTMEFIRQLKDQKNKLDGNMIGQFGVGFYSAFMVAEEITVETRHANPDEKAWKWVSDGQGTYEIEETDRTERGTSVSFRLKDEHKEFASPERIKQLIRKYSNFVDYSILVNGEEVNSQGALWHKNKNDVTEEELKEFYKFISNDFEDPLDHLHLAMEGRINFKALVFVPKKAKPDFFRTENLNSLQLYSNRVFVRENCEDLLPEYLRFAEGIVDSEDLPLNVSREVTQSSPVMAKIRDVLVSKILGMIEYWVESEPEKFRTFYDEFGPLFKSGINSDFSNRDRLIELLHFYSTKSLDGTADDAAKKGGKKQDDKKEDAKNEDGEKSAMSDMVSLKSYTERMPDSQKEIYYLSGDNLDELKRDPKLEYFRKKGIEVLLLADPVDAFVVPGIGTYNEKPLKSIEKADLDIEEDETDQKEKVSGDALEQLIRIFKDEAGDQVEDVVASRRLVESPVTLTVGKEGMDSHVEKMMKMMDQQTGPSRRVLEINPSHPVIRNLSNLNQSGKSEPVRLMARQLYDGARLMQGELESPGEFVKRMNSVLELASKQ